MGFLENLGWYPQGVRNGSCKELGSISDGIQGGFQREMGTMASGKPFSRPPHILTHRLSQAQEQPPPLLQPFSPWRNPLDGEIPWLEASPSWENPRIPSGSAAQGLHSHSSSLPPAVPSTGSRRGEQPLPPSAPSSTQQLLLVPSSILGSPRGSSHPGKEQVGIQAGSELMLALPGSLHLSSSSAKALKDFFPPTAQAQAQPWFRNTGPKHHWNQFFPLFFLDESFCSFPSQSSQTPPASRTDLTFTPAALGFFLDTSDTLQLGHQLNTANWEAS